MEPARRRLMETREGFPRLREEVARWADRRRRHDARRQFHTQLTSLEDTITGALCRLESAFAAGPDGDLYAACRLFERRTVLVRRVWTWFAEKFDQRDRPEYAKVLAAADEVAWSVYVDVIRGAGVHGLHPPPAPAPLPFLDSINAPEAVPRDEPPAALRPDNTDDLLRLLLARLPLPVVGLPVSTAWAPWTLALLGHEVGHHLEYDLLPDGRLRSDVGTAVALAGGDDADRWYTWSHELFADLVGLVTVGPSAVEALLPYELGDRDAMLDRGRGRYPAPLVRLRVAEELARRLGLAPAFGPSEPLDPGPAIQRDLARVPDVASALLGRIDGVAGLPELLDFRAEDFTPGGSVESRADLLRTGAADTDERGPHVVRELAGAALVARSALPGDDPAAVRRLADTVVDAMVNSGEEGTRSAPAVPDTVAVAVELADVLLGTAS